METQGPSGSVYLDCSRDFSVQAAILLYPLCWNEDDRIKLYIPCPLESHWKYRRKPLRRIVRHAWWNFWYLMAPPCAQVLIDSVPFVAIRTMEFSFTYADRSTHVYLHPTRHIMRNTVLLLAFTRLSHFISVAYAIVFVPGGMRPPSWPQGDGLIPTVSRKPRTTFRPIITYSLPHLARLYTFWLAPARHPWQNWGYSEFSFDSTYLCCFYPMIAYCFKYRHREFL